jgi:hypothetical protein
MVMMKIQESCDAHHRKPYEDDQSAALAPALNSGNPPVIVSALNRAAGTEAAEDKESKADQENGAHHCQSYSVA